MQAYTHVIILTITMILLPSNSADPTPTIIIDIGRQEAFKQTKIISQKYSGNFPSIVTDLHKKSIATMWTPQN